AFLTVDPDVLSNPPHRASSDPSTAVRFMLIISNPSVCFAASCCLDLRTRLRYLAIVLKPQCPLALIVVRKVAMRVAAGYLVVAVLSMVVTYALARRSLAETDSYTAF